MTRQLPTSLQLLCMRKFLSSVHPSIACMNSEIIDRFNCTCSAALSGIVTTITNPGNRTWAAVRLSCTGRHSDRPFFARHLTKHIQAAIVLDRDLDDWLSIGPLAAIPSTHCLQARLYREIWADPYSHIDVEQKHSQIPRGSERLVLSLGFHLPRPDTVWHPYQESTYLFVETVG